MAVLVMGVSCWSQAAKDFLDPRYLSGKSMKSGQDLKLKIPLRFPLSSS